MLPEQIRKIQMYLNWQLPYHKDLAITGVWGLMDRIAARGWQSSRYMAPTGKAEDIWKIMQEENKTS